MMQLLQSSNVGLASLASLTAGARVAANESDRQLLAIMFTDVVGYTAITERDEASAVRIRDAHRDLVQTLVKQFGGEVVDVTGDESFSIFGSALHAVDCAIAIQSALRSDPELRLRIGIHLGDVLRKDGEVIGEGVNVASRVRPLAEPGGICVSEPVYQMVRTRAHVTARSMGSRALKNVAQPLGVYALATTEMERDRPARSRRGLMIAGALALLVVALVALNRGPILAWLALNVPRWTGGSVEQQIGFATTSDGKRIAYATAGKGPPIVFVLGWGTHLTEGMGSPLYDQGGYLSWWSRDHLTVRYDGRGFGLSDRNVTEFPVEARVRDIETVVDALGLERFVLYAFSAGGPAGVEYTVRHPERVSRLVLAASFVAPANRTAVQQEGIAGLMRFLETGWESSAARAALAEFLAPEADEVQRRVIMHFMSVAADGPQVVGFLRNTDADLSQRAREVRVPTLVIASDADTTVPLERSRQAAALIPGARFEVVEGASHIGASIQDSRVMQLVSDFLAEDAAAGP